MKRIKKLASLLLALVMMLSMTGTAFAEEETGSITISDAIFGQTYTVYQVLDLESYNADSDAYAYKAATAWGSFINSEEIKGVYVKVDDQGYVTWIENADVAAFAKLAQKHAQTSSIENQGTITPTEENPAVEFTGLDLGYYLVDSTLGTLCSLDTTNPDVTMTEKNGAPENKKTVEEDSKIEQADGGYGDENDADIGQTVNFKSTITAQAGAENYVFHDKMSNGLTFNGTVSVTLNDNDVTEDSYTFTDYTKAGTITPEDECTFEIEFTQAFCDSLNKDDEIEISYSATVNEHAEVGSEGNPNESRLSYGDENDIKVTPPSITKTYTWDVDVFKYTEAEEGGEKVEQPLAGATFTLSKNADGSTPIEFVQEEENQLGNAVYHVATPDEKRNNSIEKLTEITTNETGKFIINGLDSDTYYLTETAAPAGYNKLAAPVTITIGKNGEINATAELPQGVSEVGVLNNSGSILPSTGGIGTTIFYAAGIILMAGALFFVIRRRKAN